MTGSLVFGELETHQCRNLSIDPEVVLREKPLDSISTMLV